MATNLSPIKEVIKRPTNEKLHVRDCQITDRTGSIKFVPWKSFAEQVKDGQTYKFTNSRLKSENVKLSLRTTQIKCSIDLCEPFPNLEPLKELPSTSKTEQPEIFGTFVKKRHRFLCFMF